MPSSTRHPTDGSRILRIRRRVGPKSRPIDRLRPPQKESTMNVPFADLHHLRFPGESADYRAARNALLAEEMELRRQTERVAAQRRALPSGGALAEDYLFEGPDGPVKLSELFPPGEDSLAIYSFMYGPEREEPCPGCTHFLDGLDGMVEHISQRLRLAVGAKSPLARIPTLARARGWRRLPLLSTAGTTYDRDYLGDSEALPAAVRAQ